MTCVLVGIGLIVVAVLSAYSSVSAIDAQLREMKKYEFENRSDGGTVRFKTFEDAEAFNKLRTKLKRKRQRSITSASTVATLVMLGFILLLAYEVLSHAKR